jgi:hypothetical protein
MSSRWIGLAIALLAALEAPAQSIARLPLEERRPHPVPARGVDNRDRVARVLSDVAWAPDVDAAFARAAREGKPVFWLQLVGNLDGDI